MAEVAERAGTDERHTREWLEQQAASGIVACVDPAATPLVLPEGRARALRGPSSLACVAGFARVTRGARDRPQAARPGRRDDRRRRECPARVQRAVGGPDAPRVRLQRPACLPVGRVAHDAAATGTDMRPHALETYALEAGLTQLEILAIENDFWRLYRLRP